MRRSTLITTTLLFAGVVAMSGANASPLGRSHQGSAATSPEATISNKQVRVKMYLPDPANGFYKGARFDWSGIISSVGFAGHTFYGQWFSKVDPTVRDVSYKDDDILVSVNTSAVEGPAQEFQTPLGYDNAKEGDRFVKIGVGVLVRNGTTHDTRSRMSTTLWTMGNGA